MKTPYHKNNVHNKAILPIRFMNESGWIVKSVLSLETIIIQSYALLHNSQIKKKVIELKLIRRVKLNWLSYSLTVITNRPDGSSSGDRYLGRVKAIEIILSKLISS